VEERLSELKEGKDLPDVRISSDPGKHKNKNKQRQVKAEKIAPHFPICQSRLRCRHLEKNASTSEENARLEAVKETFTSDFPFFMSYMRRSIVEKAKPLVSIHFLLNHPILELGHCLPFLFSDFESAV